MTTLLVLVSSIAFIAWKLPATEWERIALVSSLFRSYTDERLFPGAWEAIGTLSMWENDGGWLLLRGIFEIKFRDFYCSTFNFPGTFSVRCSLIRLFCHPAASICLDIMGQKKGQRILTFVEKMIRLKQKFESLVRIKTDIAIEMP